MTDPFVALQKLVPQHLVSRLAGRLTASTHPWLSRALIRTASRIFSVSLEDAARTSLDDYRSFDDFFTRELAPGARPMPEDPTALAAPADGTLSRFGTASGGTLIQAKGITYSLESLLCDARLARRFEGGWFATTYLAPADYHRVHMPFSATLRSTTAIPGELFSVNARTEAGISDLFCRNERLVCCFSSAAGPMVVVLVGALIVASIETVWEGPASPFRQLERRDHALTLERGSELGRFKMGSTVIVITPPGSFIPSPELRPGQRIRLGQALASLAASCVRN
jgi:phosphatidylserine decarboxylase